MSTNILDDSVESFAAWVNQLRTGQGLSMNDVAKVAGQDLSKAYVGHIETKKVLPENITLKRLIALARGLDVSAYELVNIALQEALQEERGIGGFETAERILAEDIGNVGETQNRAKRKRGRR